MKTIKIWNDAPSEKQLADICRGIEDGAVAIMPTDTLYGICLGMTLNSMEVQPSASVKNHTVTSTPKHIGGESVYPYLSEMSYFMR